MALSLSETKALIIEILRDSGRGRRILAEKSRGTGGMESEFYSALQEYSEELKLNSDQWFILLSIFRGRVLRGDLKIMAKLSENQKANLPHAIF